MRMEKITVSIPSVNVEAFQAKMDKLIKLSKKLGSGKVAYVKIGEELREQDDRKIECSIYEVIGETPTLNGYQLVAILERQKELNLINHVNKSIELPEGLDTQANYCQHCNSNRARKYLFLLLKEDTKEYIQVGKTCVKDFTGMHANPENVANWYSYFSEIEELEVIDEETFRTMRFDTYMDAKEVIALACYFTDKYGYVKRYEGNEENPCTAERINHWKRFVKMDEVENQGYFEKAEKIMEWILNNDDSGDFMTNMRTLVKEKDVNTRKNGILAYSPVSYLRAMKQDMEEKAEKEIKKKSNYVGEVGERKDYTLTFERVLSFDSMYGTTYMYFFNDVDDNVFVWKTSKYLGLTEGEEVEMKATIKEHTEYRDVKQNVLTRCKVACETK